MLPSGSKAMTTECGGANAESQEILDVIGSLGTPPSPAPNRIDVSVVLTSGAIVSPPQGATFQVPFTWTLGLDQGVVDAATGLGITEIGVSNVRLVAGVLGGAEGADVTGTPPARTVSLSGGTASFGEGPFTGSFTRTGDIGDAVTFAAKSVALTANVDLSGTPLVIDLACQLPGDASFTVVDQEGVPPTSTTSTSGPVVLGSTVAKAPLPVTGADLFWPVVLALVLIDFGYLARTSVPRPNETW
jgi:hypothetical protein